MKKQKLYLECYSGISGDMTVAALLDLGADQTVLLEGLKSLHVDGYQIEISRRAKNSIDACDFNVILEKQDHHGHSHSHDDHDHHEHSHSHDNHDHHEHSHSHDNHDHHEHSHSHENHDHHEHSHSHEDHDHHGHSHSHDDHDHQDHIKLGHHEHRNLYDINAIIDHSSITLKAKEVAKRIFHIVAVAEAKAHGKSIEEVHFHEVGAVDSIVDIVAAAICLDNLNIDEVIVSELYEGTGHITCQHGVLPVPVPAVLNIATAHNLPLHITSVIGELVTPTGAAIVAAIRTGDTLPKNFTIRKIGLGAGKREYKQASILRAMLIEEIAQAPPSNTNTDKVWVLEANIDDCTGEALSIAMDHLLSNGAKDAYYTPIYMKKNRPAYQLGVLCNDTDIEKLEDIIFTHTTTIGIRKYEATRTILSREMVTVQTPYGECAIKVCTYDDKKFYYPESDSVKKLCQFSGLDYITLYQIVQNIAFNNH